MAISKELMTTTLSIEVESGVDNKGNISYKKKNYRLTKEQKENAAALTYEDCMKIVNSEPVKAKTKATKKNAAAKTTKTTKKTASKKT